MKKKNNESNGHELKLLLANREANLANNTKSNGEEEATQRLNLYKQIKMNCQQKKKKKSGKDSNNYTAEQMGVDQAVATHFQEKILMDILNSLPVRSLLRFKCVSKFWKTLTLKPHFQKKHLNATQKFNLFNQISNGEESFNLFKAMKSIANTEKANLFNQISGKGVGEAELSNSNDTEQMDVDKPMGIHFQEDIVMDILNRLPVRSLLRFKCVSKFWGTLISEPCFQKKHLNQAKNDQNSQKLLIIRKFLDNDDVFNFYCSSLSSVQAVEDEQKIDWPSTCKPVSCKLLCGCDGFVFLVVTERRDMHFLLWNPSTRESIELPHPESPLKYSVFGMGYDATSDDYKILAVKLNESDFDKVSIEILALKSGSWRINDKYPFGTGRVRGHIDCGTDALACVHGAFHWLGMDVSYNYFVVSFSIANEVYGEIPLLEGMCYRHSRSFGDYGVSVSRGMLCFYSIMEATFNLWVMKDYGVRETWTQLLTIEGTDLFSSGIPKYLFAAGAVIRRCKCYKFFGSVLSTSRGLWPECVAVKQGIAYTESLISPKFLT